jgi:DNA polymerase
MGVSTPWSEGPLDASICLIGEAPAVNEFLKRRPFVGEAGRTLDACLHQAGLLRRTIRLENVVREKIASVAPYLSKHGLTGKGVEAAEDLRARLQEGNYKVLVPLGNLALCALTGKQAIVKHRGSPLECTLIPGARVIPTIHPAATLRRGPDSGKYIWIYDIVSDLRKAKRHSEDPHAIPQRNLIIDPTYAECMDYLKWCADKVDAYAFDIEIYNYQVSCISFAISPSSAISIPFVGARWTEQEEGDIWRMIARALEMPEVLKIGVNHVGFDIPWLFWSNKIKVAPPWGDCMLAQRIMYPEFPSSLNYLCSIHTDEPFYKDDKKMWKTPWKDSHEFWRYSAKDSATAMEIWPIQEKEMRETGYWKMYKNTMRLAHPVHFMMAKGVRVDTLRLGEVQEEVTYQLEGVEKELLEVADHDFNPGSPKQCLEYFYVHKGIRPYINRKTKRPTCDDKAMARLARKHNLPEARLVQEIRSLRKLKGTYLEMKFDEDGYLRCSYALRGTTSGRLSSSKTLRETGMNMQNLDPRFKRFLVTDEEYHE